MPTQGLDPTALHAVALGKLIAGHPHDAAADLEALARKKPATAAIWSDLAAARYDMGRRESDARAFMAAVAAADRAVQIERNHAPAHFNRALSLEALALTHFAAAAYAWCTAAEASSGWAAEARARSSGIRKAAATHDWKAAEEQFQRAAVRGDAATVSRIALRFPRQARAAAEGEYLAWWGDAVERGDAAAAARWVTIARAAGSHFDRAAGERLLSQAVAAIEKASSGDPARVGRLAAAHRTYRHGRVALKERRIEDAAALLARAEREFEAGRSPMAFAARCYRAQALVDAYDYEAALRLLESIERDAPRSYRALRAQVAWDRLRVFGRTGRTYEALKTALTAAALFDAVGESDNAAAMRMDAASSLTRLGRGIDGWKLRPMIFAAITKSGNVSLLETGLNAAARDEILEGNRETAIALLNLQLAVAGGSPVLRFDALLWQALLNGTSQNAAARRVTLESLRTAAARIPAPTLRADALDNARVVEATLIRDDHPSDAVSLLSDSVEYRRKHRRFVHLPEALVERARAYRQMGKTAAARVDLYEALDSFEERSGTVGADELRDAFLGTTDAVRDELAALLVETGKPLEAFAIAERFRARLLRDRATGGRPPVTVDAVVRRTPRDTLIIYYVTLPARTVIFAFHGGGVRIVKSRVSRADVARLVQRLEGTAGRGDIAAIRAAGRAAFDALLAPLPPTALAARDVVIIPDEATRDVPFAALVDRNSTYFFERHRIVLAPSATTYVAASHSRAGAASERLAVIGDPAFDGELFPQLSRLPDARAEARAISSLYRRAVTLTGAEASPARTIAGAQESDVVHLATHASVNERDPWNSVLLLAPAGDSGLLSVRQIAALRFRHRPLVVLAGCRTGDAVRTRGSLDSFAAAFLAAGSRGVVATLWDTDDATTRTLSVAFHRNLRSGMSYVDALRAAQLSMLHSTDPQLQHPYAWSGFQAYGYSHH